ncbi:MAG TPA: hypothetical protein VLT87_23675 [Thermoanaerobaculia bacterium]|nr:hypothetical protein [Thermoanaerobaculia bacterium]
MFQRIRRGSAALGLAAALLVMVPVPSWAGPRNGSMVLQKAWGWLAKLWPEASSRSSSGSFSGGNKEGSMIDPNGAVQPASAARPDEGSMIDPNGGR